MVPVFRRTKTDFIFYVVIPRVTDVSDFPYFLCSPIRLYDAMVYSFGLLHFYIHMALFSVTTWYREDKMHVVYTISLTGKNTAAAAAAPGDASFTYIGPKEARRRSFLV